MNDTRVGIKSPEILHIRRGESVSFGAHQLWYSLPFGKIGGCGPTAASNLLWYLAVRHPERCRALFDGDGGTHGGMLRLMREVWRYVKPGMRGVDKASIFTEGAIRYAKAHGVTLRERVLEIAEKAADRPSNEEVCRFLADAFNADLPVAFLNLSNGAVENLDNWHWVTLIAVNGLLQAQMYDQSRQQTIDLALWMKTTTKGGAFVTLEPTTMRKLKGEKSYESC